MIEHRPKLLDSKSIVLLAARSQAKRDTYAFLALALGATRVERVSDVAELQSLLGQEGWDFVCVDDAKVDDIRSKLTGNGSSLRKSAKRKRTSGRQDPAPPDISSHKIVGHEYIVQSLILGALVDG